MGAVAAFSRQGVGGSVSYGYRQVARVVRWTYTPTPGRDGAGTVDLELADVNPVYAGKSDVALELLTKGGSMYWPSAELISDSCCVVPGSPQ